MCGYSFIGGRVKMKKIVYLPLDERPCNHLFPEMIASLQKERLNFENIPKQLLGKKKQAADVAAVHDWLIAQVQEADALVVSIEMLVYGGLLPSRLHHLSVNDADARLTILRRIKKECPNIKIYAANLIMRTPKYSSDDEEPSYYATYGESIFWRAYLLDKKSRQELTDDEEKKLDRLENQVPPQYLTDYEARRKINIDVTTKVLDYVTQGIIDYLVIPQDDSAPFGYTALDQKKVQALLWEKQLEGKVAIYPGADEVGATLIARAYLELFQLSYSFYPLFPSVHSQTLIPMYEDRPLGESMKAHIYATGAKLAFDINEATIILGYNTAGVIMQESWDQLEKRDVTYGTNRNVRVLVEQLSALKKRGKKLAIADSAYANGGDLAFIRLLDEHLLLDDLLSYKGWNTNCNTLGTTLAAAIFAYDAVDEEARKNNVLYHLFDDVFYQAVVRMEITKNELEKLQMDYFDITKNEQIIMQMVEQKLQENFKKYIHHSFQDIQKITLNCYSPWQRMFELGINMQVEK